MTKSLRHRTINGVVWSALERFSVQGVSFVLGIIMARLLTPADFGLVGMLGIFTAVAGTFIDSGFGTALVRKQDRTEMDDNTVFYFNIVVSVVCYVLLYLAAPYVAAFYGRPILCLMLRITSLQLVIGSLSNIQRVYYTVSVDFKSLAKVSFGAALAGGAVGLVMAYNGCGVWSIVGQSMVGSVWSVGAMWYYSSWRPKWMFSWQSFHSLFGFGSKLLLSALMHTVYEQVYSLIIGKVYSAKELGYYTRASSLGSFPSMNITSLLLRVAFPVLSKMQGDEERLRVNYRKFLKMSAFVVFPLMCGLSAVAYPLINVLLGEQWVASAVLLRIMSFSLMWYPIHGINLNLLHVLGRSDYFLRLEIIKKVMYVSLLFVTVPIGVEAMCWGSLVGCMGELAVNSHYTGKLLGVGLWRQLRDLSRVLVLSLVMFGMVNEVVSVMGSGVWSLVVGIVVGGAFYVGASWWLKLPEWCELLAMVRGRKAVEE